VTSRFFDGLELFDTRETAEILGNAVSDIAETGLREISSTVLSIMKDEKNSIRTFAKSEYPNDNAIKKTADTITEYERGEKDDRTELGLHVNAD
jgi:hypothetical protein